MIKLASASSSMASAAVGGCRRQNLARVMQNGMGRRSMSVRPEETKQMKEGDAARELLL